MTAPRRSPAGICGCGCGWRILDRRAHVPGGEVDIVARGARTLAFVEVKARGTEAAAAFALDDKRLRRVATERLAPRYMREGDELGAGLLSRGAGPGTAPMSGKGDKTAVRP